MLQSDVRAPQGRELFKPEDFNQTIDDKFNIAGTGRLFFQSRPLPAIRACPAFWMDHSPASWIVFAACRLALSLMALRLLRRRG